ncbi:hypothetical protein [Algoriphagus sp.]|uniref:hypothetical protein n=1 Tax=Algoriphagus sp. TaxID=1872435 RepID=UPI0025D6C6E6|nr:hypothetical protein [Algoriphagus sp.]
MNKPDFLYDRKGPWPQPSPSHPFGEAPAVVHIPKDEQRTWFWNIGFRYIRNVLFYWPKALWMAWKNPTWELIDDEVFCDQIYTTPLAKFLNPNIDDNLQEIFKDQLSKKDSDSTYFVADFSCMKDVVPFKGLYVASTVALMSKAKEESRLKLHAIYIFETKLLLLPEDGDAWYLAKNYAMMGATYRILLSTHPILHFPFDTVNAITKTSLPTSNTIFKLLYPHFQFTLTLNDSVLESSSSPVYNDQKYPFTGFCGPQEGLLTLLESGYAGIEGNSSYPKFKWDVYPTEVYSDYQVYLMEYYQAFKRFTDEVVKKIPANEIEDIKIWATYISQWLPGFPSGEKIMEGDLLSGCLAKIMWDLSVAHATDHHSYGTIPINRLPLRMRVPPPASKKDTFNPKDQAKKLDVFKYALEWKMFFNDYTVTHLVDVDYKFASAELQKVQANFLQDLELIDLHMPVKRYMDLKNISVSIQF